MLVLLGEPVGDPGSTHQAAPTGRRSRGKGRCQQPAVRGRGRVSSQTPRQLVSFSSFAFSSRGSLPLDKGQVAISRHHVSAACLPVLVTDGALCPLRRRDCPGGVSGGSVTTAFTTWQA